jgi:hypothetical protein
MNLADNYKPKAPRGGLSGAPGGKKLPTGAILVQWLKVRDCGRSAAPHDNGGLVNLDSAVGSRKPRQIKFYQLIK